MPPTSYNFCLRIKPEKRAATERGLHDEEPASVTFLGLAGNYWRQSAGPGAEQELCCCLSVCLWAACAHNV